MFSGSRLVNRNTLVSLSLEEAQQRKTVLSNFNCPFLASAGGCYFTNQPERCLFAHPDPDVPQTHLRDVPYYACTRHLNNRCKHTRMSLLDDDPKPIKEDKAAYCPVGLHLNMEQMLDLEEFERTNRERILARFPSVGRECELCFKPVAANPDHRKRYYSILQSCTHCFCCTCLTTWRESTSEWNSDFQPAPGSNPKHTPVCCPVCCTVSTRVCFRQYFVDDPKQKDRLFGPIDSNNNNVNIHEEEGGGSTAQEEEEYEVVDDPTSHWLIKF